jgi:hypothetical protein
MSLVAEEIRAASFPTLIYIQLPLWMIHTPGVLHRETYESRVTYTNNSPFVLYYLVTIYILIILDWYFYLAGYVDLTL